MKDMLRKTFIILCIFFIPILIILLSQHHDLIGQAQAVPAMPRREAYENDHINKFPKGLAVQGNKILLEGKPIILKGVMAPDPHRLDERDLFHKDYYKEMIRTGANVIRVPVHPDKYYKDEYYLWRYLDPIVTWAGEMGIYVIIDWHYIGNIATGLGNEMPDIPEKPLDYSVAFWEQTATYFKNVPNIIYEIYNEPAFIKAEEWRENAQILIDTIRKTGSEQIIVAGGVDYAHDLSWVLRNPLKDSNLAYAAHVFPDRSKLNWSVYFGEIAQQYPVIITEWGFIDENRDKTHQRYLIGDAKQFGEPLLNYLGEIGVGWVAAWYDDRWEAPMFTKNYKGLTHFGEFVIKNLK